MNPDIKADWVAALRSGEYKQGQGTLRRGDKFCCLGVLYEACGLVMWHPITMAFAPSDGPPVYTNDWDEDRNVGYPSEELYEKVGLNPGDGQRLAGFNDEGKNFNLIADYIEEQL